MRSTRSRGSEGERITCSCRARAGGIYIRVGKSYRAACRKRTRRRECERRIGKSLESQFLFATVVIQSNAAVHAPILIRAGAPSKPEAGSQQIVLDGRPTVLGHPWVARINIPHWSGRKHRGLYTSMEGPHDQALSVIVHPRCFDVVPSPVRNGQIRPDLPLILDISVDFMRFCVHNGSAAL